jgi:hypothetical protein
MKNIHLIPTDKPSRLGYLTNIYITSDEEIKKGEEFWYSNGGEWYKAIYRDYYKNLFPYGKKIILTTDQDLIKDGVQAIDDTFLEWFVKNPSCERVELGFMSNITSNGSTRYYKIIIPQEEPKQNFDRSKYIAGIDPIVEKTLEEAAKIYAKIPLHREVDSEERYFNSNVREYNGFKAGANWQAERMYNKEEVKLLLDQILKEHSDIVLADIPEWFEQNRKK